MLPTRRNRPSAPLALLALPALLAAGTGSAQEPRVRVHEPWILPNGLTVVLHEDRSRPVAVVNLWYGVGSKDESPGRSGFAHLFEHLMFMGTERAPGGQFDQIMEAGGGWNNATTSFDRTNYFSTGPSSLLPTLLWLDADRLEDLGRMMTQEKLDKQREVVRNERRQSDENRPYGKADLAIDAAMFPPGHPYHFSVIGTHEDLEAATVEDVRRFFGTFYVPSNASLVVAGDFDANEIRPLIERLFGTLPARPVPPHGKAAPIRLAGVERLTLHDDVQLNRVTMAWHSPPFHADGDADLDVLAGVLADGKSSRLWGRLVRDTRLCADVSAWQGSRDLQSLFEIEATCPPESSLDEIERVIDEELAALRTKGPTAAEIERLRNRIETGKLRSLDSLLGLADQLNLYVHYRGNPDSLDWDLGRYARVTPATLRSWARRICDPQRRLIVRVLTQDPRARPEPSQAPARFAFPQPESWTLPSGLAIRLWRQEGLPLVAARLLLHGGSGSSGDGSGMAGRTSLALDMLDEGTRSMTAGQFAGALERLGATLATESQRGWSTLSIQSLSRTFDEAFGLFAEAITLPAFAPSEWERVRALRLDDLRQRDDDPAQLAGIVANREYFGAEHPFAWPVEGTVESCRSLDLDAVVARAGQILTPAGATLLVAGDIDRARLEALVSGRLGAWKGPAPGTWPPRLGDGPGPGAVLNAAREPRPFRVVLVPRPGAVQTVIRFQWPAPAFSSPDRLPLRLVNTILGGSFTSRLNQNLREEHGYTYGASSRFVHERDVGHAIASAAVRADVTGASLREFFAEFERLAAEGVPDEDRAKAVATARNALVDASEGQAGILAQAVELIGRARSIADFDRDFAALGGPGAQDLADVARRGIAPRDGLLVLVGDEAIVREQIEGLDLGPIEVVDPHAATGGARP